MPPRRVYFGFDYEDVKTFRVNVVRNHDLLKRDVEGIGFYDASIWEDAERHGELAIKRLINNGLENTSVTCILIGTRTWSRRWVRYEILKSYDRGNQLLGIHINSILDRNRQTFSPGPNPFAYLGLYISDEGVLTYYERASISSEWTVYQDVPSKRTDFDRQYWGKGYTLSAWVPVHDWVAGNGYQSFPSWVENAE